MSDIIRKQMENQALDALKSKSMALSFTGGGNRKGAVSTLREIGWTNKELVVALRTLEYVDSEIENLLGVSLTEAIDFQGSNLSVTKLVPFVVRPYNTLKGETVQGDDLPWPENVYERPDARNLKDYVIKYNQALLPDGENSIAAKSFGSNVFITKAELVDNRTSGVLSSFEMTDSEIKQLQADIPGFHVESVTEGYALDALKSLVTKALGGTRYIVTEMGKLTTDAIAMILQSGAAGEIRTIMTQLATTATPEVMDALKMVVGESEVAKVNRESNVERFADALLAGTNFVNTGYGKKTRDALIQMMMSGQEEYAEAIMNGENRIDTTQGPKTLKDVRKVMGLSESENFFMPSNNIVTNVRERIVKFLSDEGHEVDVNAVGSVVQIYGESMSIVDEAHSISDKLNTFVRALISESPEFKGMDFVVQWGKGTLNVSLNTKYMKNAVSEASTKFAFTEQFDTISQIARGKLTPADMYPLSLGICEGGEQYLKDQILSFADKLVEKFGIDKIRATELGAAQAANMFKAEFKDLRENVTSDNRQFLEGIMSFDRKKSVFRRLESLSGSRNLYADLRNSKIIG